MRSRDCDELRAAVWVGAGQPSGWVRGSRVGRGVPQRTQMQTQGGATAGPPQPAVRAVDQPH
eukprot:4826271-Prymnesium_polylepis.1